MNPSARPRNSSRWHRPCSRPQASSQAVSHCPSPGGQHLRSLIRPWHREGSVPGWPGGRFRLWGCSTLPYSERERPTVPVRPLPSRAAPNANRMRAPPPARPSRGAAIRAAGVALRGASHEATDAPICCRSPSPQIDTSSIIHAAISWRRSREGYRSRRDPMRRPRFGLRPGARAGLRRQIRTPRR